SIKGMSIKNTGAPDYMASRQATTWAEMTYYLVPNGQFAGSTPLFTLYRRRRMLADDRMANMYPTPPAAMPQLLSKVDVISYPWHAPKAINTPADITAPIRRYGVTDMAGASLTLSPVARRQLPIANHPALTPDIKQSEGGNDILLDNVVSFEIRALWETPKV